MWTSSFDSTVLSPSLFCLYFSCKAYHFTFPFNFHQRHGSSSFFYRNSINKLRCPLISINSWSYSFSLILLCFPFPLAPALTLLWIYSKSSSWLSIIIFFSSFMSFSMLIMTTTFSFAIESSFHPATIPSQTFHRVWSFLLSLDENLLDLLLLLLGLSLK